MERSLPIDAIVSLSALIIAGWAVAYFGARYARREAVPALILGLLAVALAAGLFFLIANLTYESIIRRDAIALVISGAAALGVVLLAWRGARTAVKGVIPGKPERHADSAHASPPDVFLSYKREERAAVIDIAKRLEALGLIVWFDAELRSGTAFDAEIARNVRTARCVLVCWSPGAVTSDWVRSEATIGRQRDVLAAAMLAPCELPPPFNLVQTEDLTRGVDHCPEAWSRLLDRIAALTGRAGFSAR